MKKPAKRYDSDGFPIPSRGGNAESALVTKIQAYFDRYGCPKPGSRILVAVSGGPDSVALVHLLAGMLTSHTWELGIGHVNHGLRGKESDEDASYVRQLARSIGIRNHTRRLNPAASRKESNTQAWARSERYKFLEVTAQRHEYSHIAVAHHMDDRAETVAAAVLDGGGSFALSGVPPVRGKIIRPLFDAVRTDILSYLESRGIDYRTDSSNDSIKYQRNRIRHKLLPEWRQENPAIVEGLARIGEQLWMQRRYLEEESRNIVGVALRSKMRDALTLNAAELLRHDPALDPYILRELVLLIGLDILPGPALVSRFALLRNSGKSRGASAVEQGGFSVRLSQGILGVSKKRIRGRTSEEGIDTRVPPILKTKILAATKVTHFDDKTLARFDLDAVEGELSVRWPKRGDRYQPIGMRGTKKLSDLLADRKVPSFERPLVPVVVDNRGILWPMGHPIAHRARLTDRTRRVMEARLQEGPWKNRS